mgnify:CR=1 FL=1
MDVKTRRERIEQQVRTAREVNYAELAAEFDVSEMTIRRDVEALESLGVVRRVVGGTIAVQGKDTEPSFATRMADASHTAKIGIGRDAADVSFLTTFGLSRFATKSQGHRSMPGRTSQRASSAPATHKDGGHARVASILNICTMTGRPRTGRHLSRRGQACPQTRERSTGPRPTNRRLPPF